MDDEIFPSLFEIDWFDRSNSKDPGMPYGLRLDIELNRDPQIYDSDELNPFQHAAEHEIECYEQRGLLFGPIELEVAYTEANDLSLPLEDQYQRLPVTVDPEFVQIVSCGASDVILVENGSILRRLADAALVRDQQVLLMTGSGVPRITARRFLRRLRKELGLRIHLLTDNDTWGYFIYSVLMRGAIGPHAFFPWAAIDSVNYVGIRAGDGEQYGVDLTKRRPWKSKWDLRLNAMRQYSCFESSEWQAEFKRFEQQDYAVNLLDFIEAVGGVDSFATSYLLSHM